MILRKCSHESKKNEDLALQERFVVIETLILGEEAEVEAEAGKEEYEAEVGIGHLLPLPFHHPIISLLPLRYLLDLRIPGREVVVGHLQDDHGHLRNLLVLLHLHVPTCHIAVTIKIMRYSVCVEGVLNETRTVTNQGENPEVLNQKEEDIEDNKKIIAKLTITDKFGDELT